VFAFLVSASGALMVIIYLLACFAHLKLRRQIESTDPQRLELKMWWFPWLTWLTIAAMIGVLAAMAITPALATQLYASLVAVAVAGAAYGVVRARRKRAGS
jgi:L-asparagine transporter-like permease